MATLNLDGKLYDLEKISVEAKAKIDSARFCDKKITELEAELAIVRTAKAAYLGALPALVSDDALQSEEISSAEQANSESITH